METLIYKTTPIVFFNEHAVKNVVSVTVTYQINRFARAIIALPAVSALLDLPFLTHIRVGAKIETGKGSWDIWLVDGFPEQIVKRDPYVFITIVDKHYILDTIPLIGLEDPMRAAVMSSIYGDGIINIALPGASSINQWLNCSDWVSSQDMTIQFKELVEERITNYLSDFIKTHQIYGLYPFIDPAIDRNFLDAQLSLNVINRLNVFSGDSVWTLIRQVITTLTGYQFIPIPIKMLGIEESAKGMSAVIYCSLITFPVTTGATPKTQVVPLHFYNYSFSADKTRNVTRMVLYNFVGMPLPSTSEDISSGTESSGWFLLVPRELHNGFKGEVQASREEQICVPIIYKTMTYEEVCDGIITDISSIDLPLYNVYQVHSSESPLKGQDLEKTMQLCLDKAELEFKLKKLQFRTLTLRGIFSPFLVCGMPLIAVEKRQPLSFFQGIPFQIIHEISDRGAVSTIDCGYAYYWEEFSEKTSRGLPGRFAVFPWGNLSTDEKLILPRTTVKSWNDFVKTILGTDCLSKNVKEVIEYLKSILSISLEGFFGRCANFAKTIGIADRHKFSESQVKIVDVPLNAKPRQELVKNIVNLLNAAEIIELK
ncbi:MAG: hypothetical protein QXG39_07985 [Candidatus Aenigmatarchaeota archaeon]